jgi:hypothetical protein
MDESGRVWTGTIGRGGEDGYRSSTIHAQKERVGGQLDEDAPGRGSIRVKQSRAKTTHEHAAQAD